MIKTQILPRIHEFNNSNFIFPKHQNQYSEETQDFSQKGNLVFLVGNKKTSKNNSNKFNKKNKIKCLFCNNDKLNQRSNKNPSKKINASLNPNNILITKSNIQKILRKGKVEENPIDLEIWQTAFVHKSYVQKKDFIVKNDNKNKILLEKNKIVPFQKESNEVYEWLGDSLLGTAVTCYLNERYGKHQDEGFLTKLRSKLVRTENLSFLAKKIGLSKYLLISHHVEFSCEGRSNDRILENTFESFIGAMHTDFKRKYDFSKSFGIIRKFIINIIEKYVDISEMIAKDDNAKDQLMWYFQKNFSGQHPIYNKEKYENDNFYMFINEPGSEKIVGKGFARSKKKAEQKAAKNALEYYAEKDGIKK